MATRLEKCQWPLKKQIALYTVFYLLGMGILVGIFAASGKSFIRDGDAFAQHFPALVTISRWLRHSAVALLTEGKLPQLWMDSLGYGADFLLTLHHYGVGDPLVLLSALVPADYLEYYYDFLVLLRLYLAGITLTVFFRSRGRSPLATLLGAVVYVFSGFAMNPAVFHPVFALPLIYLPLLLYAVDRLYLDRSWKPMTVAVFLAAVSSLYFFYMLAIMTVLYALMRYFELGYALRPRVIFTWLGRFLGAALIGCILAFPILIPCGASLLLSDRNSVSRTLELFYPGSYYSEMPVGLMANRVSYYFYVAVSAGAVLSAVMILFAPVRRFLPEKCSLALFAVFAVFPFFGSALNGFTYPTNRWIWALVLLLCWCAGTLFDDRGRLTRLQLTAGFAAVLGYFFLLFRREDGSSLSLLLPGAMLAAAWCLFALSSRIPRKVSAASLCAIMVLGSFSNIWLFFAPSHDALVSAYHDSGVVYRDLAVPALEQISRQADAGAYRFETSGVGQRANSASIYGLRGVDYYFSLANIPEFQTKSELNHLYTQQFSGLDKRAWLESFLGVRYFAVPTGQARPFGYDIPVTEGETLSIYGSSNALPMVFAYDSVTANDPAFSPAQRQQLQLQCALMDERVDLPDCDPSFWDRDLSCTVTADRVTIDGSAYVTQEGNTTLTLEFEPVDHCELYLVIEGLFLDSPENRSLGKIVVSGGDTIIPLRFATPRDNFYTAYEDYCINLGYSEEPRDTVSVTFTYPGTYTIDSLKVVSQDMEALPELAARLQNSGITISSQDRGAISFTSQRSAPGMACITVPFSDGWSAKVNGKSSPVYRINNGFCGVLLPEGECQVSLTYRTPYLLPGCVLSGTMLAALLLMHFVKKRK